MWIWIALALQPKQILPVAEFFDVTGRKILLRDGKTQHTGLFDRQLTVLLGVGRIAGRERSIHCRVCVVQAAVGGVEAVAVRLVQGGLGEGERVVGGGANSHQGGHCQEGVHLQQQGAIEKDRQREKERERERLFSIPFIKTSTHWAENPIYIFLEKKLRGRVPNSCIPVSVSKLYIPGIGLPIWGMGVVTSPWAESTEWFKGPSFFAVVLFGCAAHRTFYCFELCSICQGKAYSVVNPQPTLETNTNSMNVEIVLYPSSLNRLL